MAQTATSDDARRETAQATKASSERGKPLPVYGGWLQIRDWLHVADHCRAISLTLTRGRAGEVYNR